MSELNSKTASIDTSQVEIRIVNLNTDRTRKVSGSSTQYQVTFVLSADPPREWRDVFDRVWKDLVREQEHQWYETVIDRSFVVTHCTLTEVVPCLRLLQQAITLTNPAHRQLVYKQLVEQARRNNVWKLERDAVEAMAATLHYN
jgi:hypothetical protein